MIKAIDTEYNGYRFRSRTEARWAVFFDSANIKYEYECEGYELSDGRRYLPDFYLPEWDYFVEVKPPREGVEKEIDKVLQFVEDTKLRVLILGAVPVIKSYPVWHYWVAYYEPLQREAMMRSVALCPGGLVTWLAVDRLNVKYGSLGAEKWINGESDFEIYKRVQGTDSPMTFGDTYCSEDLKVLSDAYKKANHARFEYGEKGA